MRSLFPSRRSGGLWQAILLLLSLALAGQGIAVQAHRHAPAQTCLSAPDCSAKPAKPHKPDHCALCQEARTAGHYLPVAALFVALALLAGFLPQAVPAPVRPAMARPLPWRSRAPPRFRPVATPPIF